MECCSIKLNAKQLSTSIWEYSWLPHICIDCWAKSAQWWIQGRAIIGQQGPFSKGLLLQSWKATATNRMYSSDLTAFGKMFWCCTVLDLVISTYFNHVNGAKCLIHINLCTESDLFPFLFSCILKKEKQYKIAMILLCPVQGPWASSFILKIKIKPGCVITL